MALSIWVVSAALAMSSAGDDAQKAREEVEHQLAELVKIPAPTLEVVFAGIDQPDYALESASFELDGKPLPTTGLAQGRKVIFSGTVAPGPHSLRGTVVYKETPKTLFTYMSGTKFKIPTRVELNAEAGLRIRVLTGAHVDSTGFDLRSRVKPLSKVEAEMVAQLDDGTMPEPLKRVVIAPQPAPEPVEVAEATPAPLTDADEAMPAHPKHRVQAKTPRRERMVVAAVLRAPSSETVPANAVVEHGAETEQPEARVVPLTKDVEPADPALASLSLQAKAGFAGGLLFFALAGLAVARRRR